MVGETAESFRHADKVAGLAACASPELHSHEHSSFRSVWRYDLLCFGRVFAVETG